jgi:hypothetical protein
MNRVNFSRVLSCKYFRSTKSGGPLSHVWVLNQKCCLHLYSRRVSQQLWRDCYSSCGYDQSLLKDDPTIKSLRFINKPKEWDQLGHLCQLALLLEKFTAKQASLVFGEASLQLFYAKYFMVAFGLVPNPSSYFPSFISQGLYEKFKSQIHGSSVAVPTWQKICAGFLAGIILNLFSSLD